MTYVDAMLNAFSKIFEIKRIRSAANAQLLGQLGNIFFRFVGVAIYFDYLGAEVYGQWLYYLSLASLYGLLEFGIFNTFFNKMTLANHKGEFDEFQENFISLNLICIFISVVGFFTFQLINFIVFSGLENYEMLVYAVLLNIWFGAYSGLFRCVKQQHKLFYFGNLQQFLPQTLILLSAMTVSVSEFLYFAPIIWFIANLVGFAILVGYISLYGPIFLKKGSLSPSNFLCLIKSSVSSIKTEAKNIFGFGIASGNQWIENNFPVLFLQHAFGSEAVSVFSAIKGVSNSLRAVLAILIQSLWAEFTISDTNSDGSDFKKLANYIVKITMLVYLLSGGFVLILGIEFLRMWLGYEGLLFDSWSLILIWGNSCVLAVLSVYASILMATTKINFFAKLNLLAYLLLGAIVVGWDVVFGMSMFSFLCTYLIFSLIMCVSCFRYTEAFYGKG